VKEVLGQKIKNYNAGKGKVNTPIIMAAFGTTTSALETYSFINKRLSDRFPDHEIIWSYSSRMVKDWIKKRRNIDLKHPHEVLHELKERGHSWAVVQSLHLLCGHEFYRLIEEVKQSTVRTSVGLPLLSSPKDYEAVVQGLGSRFQDLETQAQILIGHGTDHPIWSSYVALNHMFREKYGPNIHIGVIEGHPSRDKIIDAVIKSRIKKVRMIPFMLVAGTHFQEDLAGDGDSWKTAFEKKEVLVSIESNGLGFNPKIVDIFSKHIQDALDVIPSSSTIKAFYH
jgi:sirohydrochlorin cobaltochelatase